MQHLQDVTALLKARFSLIEKFSICENSDCPIKKMNNNTLVYVHHLFAYRETLEDQEEDVAGHQSNNNSLWSVFVIRIPDHEERNDIERSVSVEQILNAVTSSMEQCECGKGLKNIADDIEKTLLVLEQGGGLSIRELRIVV